MAETIYVLKKDTVTEKAGQKYRKCLQTGGEDYYIAISETDSNKSAPGKIYLASQVEGNSEWFQEYNIITMNQILKSQNLINRVVLNFHKFSPENMELLKKAQMDGLMDEWRYGQEIELHPDDFGK